MKKKQYIQPEIVAFNCIQDNPLLTVSITTVDSGDADLFLDDDDEELEIGRSRYLERGSL